MLVWLALSAGAVAHAQPSPPIIVSNSTELQAAVVPGNAGRAILVRAGDYEVGQPLVVPDGATLTGEGVMDLGQDGLPVGFRAGTRTTLRSTSALVGNIVSLSNGTLLSGLAIEDQPGRTGGNIVVVSSRGPGDLINATIEDCELINPNVPGIVSSGPSGRGLVVITRNPLGLSPPAPHEGAVIGAHVRRSIVSSPANGTGIFAINFAPHAQISINLEGNIIGGGLDASGGVSRPVSVVGSTTRIDSRGNLFRADGVQTGLGWSLMGGGGPPIPLIIGSTSDNLLAIDSTEDRIEGFLYGIYAKGGVRNFGPPTAGTSDRNRAELYLRGTRITSVLGDVIFVGALANGPTVTVVGDGNVLRVQLSGVTGSQAPNNFYANATGNLPGVGNRVEIQGNPVSLLNRGINPPPPIEMFIGRN